jgi:nucleotide-binding universal stress UspA family protein
VSRIVVGFDASPAAEAALMIALEEAKLRQLPLRVVSCWEIPPLEYAGTGFANTADLAEAAERHAHTVLAAAQASLGPDPGVPFETVAVHGHPANVLAEEADDATIVVVGTRGSSTIKGLLIGSVSQALSHHCNAPLLIVPAPAGS